MKGLAVDMGVDPREKSAEDAVPSRDPDDIAIPPVISQGLVGRADVEQPSTAKPKDIPPEGGYGWVCVACVTFINAHTWGVNTVRLTSVKSLSYVRAMPEQDTDGLKQGIMTRSSH